MIVKCQCQSCAGPVEFDADQFEMTGETAYRKIGQTIDCPHCHQPTAIYIVKIAAPPKTTPPVRPATAAPVNNSDFLINAGGFIGMLFNCGLFIIGCGLVFVGCVDDQHSRTIYDQQFNAIHYCTGFLLIALSLVISALVAILKRTAPPAAR